MHVLLSLLSQGYTNTGDPLSQVSHCPHSGPEQFNSFWNGAENYTKSGSHTEGKVQPQVSIPC